MVKKQEPVVKERTKQNLYKIVFKYHGNEKSFFYNVTAPNEIDALKWWHGFIPYAIFQSIELVQTGIWS